MLILEKVDAMVLAAMQAGDETASFDDARERVNEWLNEPLPSRWVGATIEESEVRVAVGLRA